MLAASPEFIGVKIIKGKRKTVGQKAFFPRLFCATNPKIKDVNIPKAKLRNLGNQIADGLASYILRDYKHQLEKRKYG